MTQVSQDESKSRPAPDQDIVVESPPSPEGSQQTPVAPSGIRGVLSNLAVPLILVIAALAIGAALINSPPDVPRSDPETLAPVVGLAELVPLDTKVYLDAFGTVVASREIRIMPEVSGRIIELNERLEPGGLIAEGELLVRIDPTDYEIAVAQVAADLDVARHEVSRIHARIQVLEGRGKQLDVEIAYLQWNAERLGSLAEQNSAAQFEARDAVTQLDSRKAARMSLDAEILEQQNAIESGSATVRVAERRLETAKLALQRTSVTAPFDAIIVTENVEVGQLISPQTSIAVLASTDEFWAEAAIPVARLQDVRFADENAAAASPVTVSMATGDGQIVREGVALRPLGNLDPLGRMARVLVSIDDPLGLADRAGAARRVLLGSYVRMTIESGTLRDVYSIPRKALRENDRVWVRDAEGKLAIRPVTIVWRRQEDVLVRDGFSAGDQLVTTHLASVVPGMPLRVRTESVPSGDPTTDSKGVANRGVNTNGGAGSPASATP